MRKSRLGAVLMVAGLIGGAVGAAEPSEVVRDANPAPALDEDARTQWDVLKFQLERRTELQPLMATAFHPSARLLDTDRDPLDITLRRVRALLADLKTVAPRALPAGVEPALEGLVREAEQIPPGDAERRYAVYRRLCAVRRSIAFANPLVKIDRLLLACYHDGNNHIVDQFFGYRQTPGGGLVVLEAPFSDTPVARDLLAGVKVNAGSYAGQMIAGRGKFLSPSVSYDGKTVFFAWCEVAGPPAAEGALKEAWKRIEIDFADEPAYNPELDRLAKWNPQNTFHLFKVGADGSDLRQLTEGPFNEFDPCEMPDGRLIFVSERRGGFGRCHGRYCPTYTLHVCQPDGSGIETLSYHESNEWKPVVNHDGMIVFQRWDYWDRGSLQAHHPWITTPDGYDPRALQGNYPAALRDRPNAEADLQPVPRSHTYLGVATAHHGAALGALIVIDPRVADDQKMSAVRRFTPEVPFPEVEEAREGGPREVYATPWPLSETYCLASYRPRDRRGIYLVDAFGNKELVWAGPVGAYSPMPLAPRPRPPVVPRRFDARNIHPAQTVSVSGRPVAMGPVRIANVYDTDLPLPEGVKIRAVRVLQVVQKSFPLHNNPRIGYGIDKGARAVLGTVPVEEDGSVHFLAPVQVPLFFHLLDEQGLAVQGMRSDTWVNRGQDLTCLGCHEPRQRAQAPPPRYPAAFQRAPSVITPDVEGSNPFSFPRLVQPVLDRSCVDCHRRHADKAPDLARGDFEAKRSNWYTSYENLQKFAFFYGWPHQKDRNEYDTWTPSRTVPGRFGARASRLYDLLARGHHEVKLDAGDLHRITLWLDCNSDFFGAYENPAGQARGEVVRPVLE